MLRSFLPYLAVGLEVAVFPLSDFLLFCDFPCIFVSFQSRSLVCIGNNSIFLKAEWGKHNGHCNPQQCENCFACFHFSSDVEFHQFAKETGQVRLSELGESCEGGCSECHTKNRLANTSWAPTEFSRCIEVAAVRSEGLAGILNFC